MVLAVVAKKLVVVALVEVEFKAVKFWSVVEPLAKRFANVLRALKLFVSASKVDDAAFRVILAVPLNDTPLIVRAFWRAVAVPALPVILPVIGFEKVLVPLNVLLSPKRVVEEYDPAP